MSAPADRLERLSLEDVMQTRSRTLESQQSARSYDTSNLTQRQADAARDGISSQNFRLLPNTSRAVYPEEGYIGFKITETHQLRIPVAGDQDDRSASPIHCSCSTFARDSICDHFVWLYDNVQQALKVPVGRTEILSTDYIQRRFSELVSDMSDADSKPLTEAINSQQTPDQRDQQVDQNVLDILSIFDKSPTLEEPSSRKKPRRDNDSPDGSRSMVPEMKTCLEFDIKEFFAQLPPTFSITDLIVPGDLLESMKGLARHSMVLRELLNNIVDDRYLARDFVGRLRHDFEEHYLRWKEYHKDNRRTVPINHIVSFASKIRQIVSSLRKYDSSPNRQAPKAYYHDAIDLAITILGKVAGADLEYSPPLYLSEAEDPDKNATYTATQSTNVDVYEGHSRQPKDQKPEKLEARNLFCNLIISPPSGAKRLIDDIAELLWQWRPNLTEELLANIAMVGRALDQEMQKDSKISKDTRIECLGPLRQLLRAESTR